MEAVLCIVAIVERGQADKVVAAVKNAGASGATILYGRGTGEHEAKSFFNIHIESSKEIILMVVSRKEYALIRDEIIEVGKLKEPGKGIMFTLPIDNLVGLRHRLIKE